MSEVSFHPVTLEKRWVEAQDLVGLRVSLDGTALAPTFQNPGQYVQLRLPSGRIGFFAIASRPGEGNGFEFLVKAGGEIPDELLALGPGDRLEMSAAMGQGYPIQHHRGKDVLLFAVGSGISPIRSLIWYLAAHRADYAGVTLFFGARTPQHFAYQDEVAAWQAEGVQVVRVVSREDGTDAGYVHGYVQNAVKAHPIEPANTVAFVCGMKEMVQGVTEELAALGVNGDRIFQNF
jgi:sulfhydrogenase subunit gamma (sulfur reductase)